MRRFLLTLDEIHILCLVYSNFCGNKLRIKHQTYPKSTKIISFVQKICNVTVLRFYISKSKCNRTKIGHYFQLFYAGRDLKLTGPNFIFVPNLFCK